VLDVSICRNSNQCDWLADAVHVPGLSVDIFQRINLPSRAATTQEIDLPFASPSPLGLTKMV